MQGTCSCLTRIRSAWFEVKPTEDVPDPLFGLDEESSGLAQTTVQHELTWQFTHTVSKTAYLAITESLLRHLGRVEGIIVSVQVRGDEPS